MEEVEVVIKIPEKIFRRIQALARDGYFEHDICCNSMRRIANGMPLPEGHGDLVDKKALCDYFWDNRSKLYTHKDLQIAIEKADAIIKADKKGELEENLKEPETENIER